MFQEFNNVSIEYISSSVPSKAVGNSFFSTLLTEKEIKVFEKTVGIKERRWADKGVTASDLGFAAAEELLKQVDKSKIKSLIFLSQTSDYKIPFTSNILQDKLGLQQEILCFDINAGCAGFVQGLSTAFSIVSTLKEGEKVLLIIGETLSKILSPTDKSTNMLFGDAASAILVSKNSSADQSYFNFFSDGAHHEAIIIPEGGYRKNITKDSFDSENESGLYLNMNGAKVFDFTLREVAPSIKKIEEESSVNLSEIDGFFFHQSNRFIIKQISSILGIDNNKVPVNIERFGNTSGVTIPLLITTNLDTLENKSKVLCSGYGSGLSWGNCIINLSETKILPLKEI